MPLVVREVTPPNEEPVSLSEAKAHLRVTFDEDDALIGSLVTAARRLCEVRGGIVCVNTVFDLVVDAFPCGSDYFVRVRWPYSLAASETIALPRAPLVSVASVTYLDCNGDTQTLDASAYRVVAGSPGRLSPAFGAVWPATLPVPGAVAVRFTAGYGATAASTPANVKAAVLLVLGHLYNNREAVSQDGAYAVMPCDLSVDGLLGVENGTGGYS